MDRLPPLLPDRSGLVAIPRPTTIPCVRVPVTASTVCVGLDGVTGQCILNEGDWHFMPDLATHFTLGARQVLEAGAEQISPPESVVYHLLDKAPSAAFTIRELMLCAFWAGRGYAVAPMCAVRQRSAVVVGQVAAIGGAVLDRLSVPNGWRGLRGYIMTEQDGSNVRILDVDAAQIEFRRLIHPETKEVIVDFGARSSIM